MNPQRDEFHESPSSHAIRHERLILFTRYPVPGRVKTRLIPALGPEGAARLQRRLTLCALRSAEALRARFGIDVEIHFDGASESSMRHWLGDRFGFWLQVEGDLGRRMAGAFEKSFREGTQAAVIIGADCPELTPDILAEAFSRLRQHPVVLGPAKDGGYYLVGLRQPIPQLFLGIEWGASTVLADTLQILERLGIRPFLLDTFNDIDRPEDLLAWRRRVDANEADLNQISVIIPALNESENIASTVAAAAEGQPLEIIVVDGASSDRTAERAREAGATVFLSRVGRARQMNAGASNARGNVLLFLHADTLLPRGYSGLAAQQLRESGVAAGAFRFAVSHAFAGSKFLEWTTNLRSRWMQMPYGDQGLFLRRSLFEELGGFADLPILEDYELVRRLRGCGRVITVREPVLTSARRWERLGVLRVTLINQWIVAGYHLGWPIKSLAACYGVRNAT